MAFKLSMNKNLIIIGVLAVIAAAEACIILKPEKEQIAAQFSGEQITLKQLDGELRRLYGPAVLQDMITERLIDKSIAQAKISVTPDELKAWIADYKKRPDAQELLASNQLNEERLQENLSRSVPMYKLILQNVSEADRKKYFNDHKNRFEEVELRSILLGSEAEAEALLPRIKGEDGFSSLAMVHSLDPQTRDFGGSLGRVTRSELEETFDPLSVKELFAQKIGTVCRPMSATGGGWYLFYVKGRAVDYDPLRLRVIEVMASERLQSFLEKLRLQADVKILWPENASAKESGNGNPVKDGKDSKDAE